MSLVKDVTDYYAARAPVFDQTAGYTDPEVEKLRAPLRARYRDTFRNQAVLEIACGTGYWTAAIAESAESVHGVDVNPAVLVQAEQRCRTHPHVTFQVADAYTLEGVPGGFSAAFAHWWWSHIPVEELSTFLAALHGKLQPGALVLFVDQLPCAGHVRRKDSRGNTIEQRSLPDGRRFEIVKNFPSEQDIRSVLCGIADKVEYCERPEEGAWSVMYRKR